jgi:hypothetical protein
MGWYSGGRAQTRNCTDDYVRLDVRWLKRQGYLRPGASGMAHWQHKHYPVAVEWTPCPFGGNRAWFRCPACSRRAERASLMTPYSNPKECTGRPTLDRWNGCGARNLRAVPPWLMLLAEQI